MGVLSCTWVAIVSVLKSALSFRGILIFRIHRQGQVYIYILSCPHPHPYTFKRRVFAIMNQRTSQLMLALRKLRKGAVLLEVTPSHICRILLVVYTSVLSLACGVPGRSAWSDWECSWEGRGFWILSTRSCFMEKKKRWGCHMHY